jgi:Raf kinase inhibitor-like YbhB/YbcL family protein
MSARSKIFFAAGLLAGLITTGNSENSPTNGVTMKLQITTPAFAAGQPIPRRHTGEGQNLSPALQWSDVPPAAKSLALICDDPDAPAGTWVHWVIYDLPSVTTHLSEGVAKTPELANGAKQGMNSWPRLGYDGPMPPPGKPHRYFFKLYALDAATGLKSGATKKDLLQAMEDHVLAEGEVMGTYQRK